MANPLKSGSCSRCRAAVPGGEPLHADHDPLPVVVLDLGADLQMAEAIVLNAKTQRPGVCNAAESLLVHEAALIFESGGEALVDGVAVVDAPAEVRIARAMARDGSSREQVEARMRHQLQAEVLRERADFVLDNSGSESALQRQGASLFRRLTTAA